MKHKMFVNFRSPVHFVYVQIMFTCFNVYLSLAMSLSLLEPIEPRKEGIRERPPLAYVRVPKICDFENLSFIYCLSEIISQ